MCKKEWKTKLSHWQWLEWTWVSWSYCRHWVLRKEKETEGKRKGLRTLSLHKTQEWTPGRNQLSKERKDTYQRFLLASAISLMTSDVMLRIQLHEWTSKTHFPSYLEDIYFSVFCCAECLRYIRWLEILCNTSTKIMEWVVLYKLLDTA